MGRDDFERKVREMFLAAKSHSTLKFKSAVEWTYCAESFTLEFEDDDNTIARKLTKSNNSLYVGDESFNVVPSSVSGLVSGKGNYLKYMGSKDIIDSVFEGSYNLEFGARADIFFYVGLELTLFNPKLEDHISKKELF